MKTWEMIKMLTENPKLKFADPEGNIAMIDQFYVLRWQGQGNGRPVNINIRHENWQLVPEPVPVWEAIKAYMEGKTVTCWCKQKCKKADGCEYSKTGSDPKDFCKAGILEGTWYIEEAGE